MSFAVAAALGALRRWRASDMYSSRISRMMGARLPASYSNVAVVMASRSSASPEVAAAMYAWECERASRKGCHRPFIVLDSIFHTGRRTRAHTPSSSLMYSSCPVLILCFSLLFLRILYPSFLDFLHRILSSLPDRTRRHDSHPGNRRSRPPSPACRMAAAPRRGSDSARCRGTETPGRRRPWIRTRRRRRGPC